MRKKITIRLAEDVAAPVTWVVSDGSEEGPSMIKHGTLEEAAQVAQGARVVLLVPASDVVLLSAAVPATNKRKMIGALPFALEDQLADDIEELHFAIGQRNEAGQLNAAVVSLSRMRRWLARLAEHGLQADAAFPETLALPYDNGRWTLLLTDELAVMRTAEQSGLAVDPANLSSVLEMALVATGETKPETLRVIDCRAASQTPLEFPQSLNVEHELSHEPPVAVFAGALDERTAINLLQGEFSRREQMGKYWRPWIPAASLASVLILLHLGGSVIEKVRLQNEVEALQQKVSAVYFDTFPESKRLVPGGERSQMQQKLAELRGGGGGSSQFLGLLAKVGEQFSATPGLELDRINYRAGELNVAFKIPDLQRLDQLKQQLAEKAGLAIDIQSATSRDGKVEARLQISGKGT